MKKILVLIICVICSNIVSSAQDKKYTFEKFGLKNELYPTPTIFNETITIMGNEQKGTYYIYIESENFKTDIVVKFFRYGDKSTPYSYYYLGDAAVGHKQYNKVLIATNSKLSDIANGNGNNIDTPFDDKYIVSVLFSKIQNSQVTDMLYCDFYFIKNQTEQEEQDKLMSERIAIKLKALERRTKIDSFLAERKDSIYAIETMDRYKYNKYKKILSNAITSTIEQFNPKNLDLTLSDSVYIDMLGNAKHLININSRPEIYELNDAIRKQVEQCRLPPITVNISGTDTTCNVSTKDYYTFEYHIKTENEKLKLKKKKSFATLQHGNNDFFNSNKDSIIKELFEGNGIYHIDVEKKQINGSSEMNVKTTKFRSLNSNFMLGYNYATFAPVGALLGINNIACTYFGIFAKFGNKSGEKPETTGDSPISSEDLSKNISRFYWTAGITCSVTQYGYLYAGIGSCNTTDYTPRQTGDEINYSPLKNNDLNIEAGIIIRPLKWLGLSVGYNYIAGDNPFGGANLGAMIIF